MSACIALPLANAASASSRRWRVSLGVSPLQLSAKPSPARQRSGRRSRLAHSSNSYDLRGRVQAVLARGEGERHFNILVELAEYADEPVQGEAA